jgi:hypothetical protein
VLPTQTASATTATQSAVFPTWIVATGASSDIDLEVISGSILTAIGLAHGAIDNASIAALVVPFMDVVVSHSIDAVNSSSQVGGGWGGSLCFACRQRAET